MDSPATVSDSPGGGAGGGGNPPVNAILFDGQLCKVKGLSYSSSEKTHSSASLGTQYTEFALSLQYTPPPNWQTTGEYLWKPLWGPGASLGSLQLRVKGTGTGATATGAAYRAGVHTVTCDIKIREIGNPENAQWVSLQGSCAVIGGPLLFFPEAMSFTYNQDTFGTEQWKTNYGPFNPAAQAVVPDHDDHTKTMPYHLQFFGFDPRVMPHPANSQVPRARLTGKSELAQPEGTQFLWEISNPAAFDKLAVGGGGSPVDDVLTGMAIGPGQFTLRCKFKLAYSNGLGSDTLEIWDNTTLTPRPDNAPGETLLRTNVVNVHQPTTTESGVKKEFRPHWVVHWLLFVPFVVSVSNPQSYGGTMSGDCYEVVLRSQMGKVMPGVWVQERFFADPAHQITMPPVWFVTNQNSGPTWCTTGIEEVGRLGRFFFDYIWLWTDPTGSPQTFIFGHEYFAATRSITSGGIPVGKWKMTFNIGASPNSIGTTTHVKIN